MGISDPYAAGAVRRVALATAQNGGRAVAQLLAPAELRGIPPPPSNGPVAAAIGAGRAPDGKFVFLLVGVPLAIMDGPERAQILVCASARLQIGLRLTPEKTLMVGEMFFAALEADPELRMEMARLRAHPDPYAALAEMEETINQAMDQ